MARECVRKDARYRNDDGAPEERPQSLYGNPGRVKVNNPKKACVDDKTKEAQRKKYNRLEDEFKKRPRNQVREREKRRRKKKFFRVPCYGKSMHKSPRGKKSGRI